MTETVFIIAILSGIAIFSSLLWSIFIPAKRIWPPPRRSSWQFWSTWIFYVVNIGSGIALGWLDWNSGPLETWVRFPVGGLLVVGGLTFARWGIKTLGWHQSSGLKGPLVQSGPYLISRNPQYVGDSLAMLGFAIFTNSPLVMLVNLIGIVSMLITPFTEESWLEDRFGEDYKSYKKESARYLDFKKIGKLFKPNKNLNFVKIDY